MNDKKDVFETMPVPKALATLAVPTIISQLITMIYNLADTFFIGRTNDPYKVAASSLSYVLFFIMNALSNLFGIGGGTLISRLLGIKDRENAKKVCSFSFYGTIVVAGLYSLGVLVFMDPLLRLLGASNNTIGYSSRYTLWVIVVGGIPSTLSMTMAHILRSEGYAKQASTGLSMGGILNIVLDPLFMFVILPKGLEVTGAAVATMLSNVCSLIYFCIVFYVLRNKTVLSVSLKNVLPSGRHIRSIFAVGLPSAIGTLLACLSNTVINKLSSGYGDIPVASMGIVKKVDMLPMNVGMGLCQGMLPLVAYNYSAGNYKRMKQSANSARIAGICFAAICIVVFQLFATNIVRLFINEPETIKLGTNFLRIACIAVPFTIINVQMSYTFQAIGKGPQSLLLSSCRQGLINIPLLFIMDVVFGMYGVIWTQAIADGITLVISFALYRKLDKEINSKIKVQKATCKSF